jgi:hypothetical protein
VDALPLLLSAFSTFDLSTAIWDWTTGLLEWRRGDCEEGAARLTFASSSSELSSSPTQVTMSTNLFASQRFWTPFKTCVHCLWIFPWALESKRVPIAVARLRTSRCDTLTSCWRARRLRKSPSHVAWVTFKCRTTDENRETYHATRWGRPPGIIKWCGLARVQNELHSRKGVIVLRSSDIDTVDQSSHTELNTSGRVDKNGCCDLLDMLSNVVGRRIRRCQVCWSRLLMRVTCCWNIRWFPFLER